MSKEQGSQGLGQRYVTSVSRAVPCLTKPGVQPAISGIWSVLAMFYAVEGRAGPEAGNTVPAQIEDESAVGASTDLLDAKPRDGLLVPTERYGLIPNSIDGRKLIGLPGQGCAAVGDVRQISGCSLQWRTYLKQVQFLPLVCFPKWMAAGSERVSYS